ncbi:hypothetical protein BWQ92_10030 [Arthrobacter sp. QXT-31]|nr:hypothetical protein BWQ92_10030 [Arthrobacter sp. QXT-31]
MGNEDLAAVADECVWPFGEEQRPGWCIKAGFTLEGVPMGRSCPLTDWAGKSVLLVWLMTGFPTEARVRGVGAALSVILWSCLSSWSPYVHQRLVGAVDHRPSEAALLNDPENTAIDGHHFNAAGDYPAVLVEGRDGIATSQLGPVRHWLGGRMMKTLTTRLSI